jgi:acyl carrier protein
MMTTTTLSRESILSELQRILTEQFELDRQAITPEAHLYQDLDIDSIDAAGSWIRKPSSKCEP